MKKLTRLIPLFAALIVSACGGGSSGSSSGDVAGSGVLSVGLTDAPVVNAENVVIYFTQVQLHGDDGTTTEIPVYDPLTGLPGRSIDLLQLQGDKSIVLFREELPAGNYSWLRLELDLEPQRSYIQINGQQHALRCTSCQNSGYKLNRSFKVETDAVMAYTVDFDLRKSITLSNNGYHLRPTLRVVQTAAAGHLSGVVDGTLISQLGGEAGCAVYVYEGHNVVANDIYLPEAQALPAGHHNPVASAAVAASSHDYTVGFLAAGNYTVALTCDAERDDVASQDSAVEFYGATNVTIAAGQITMHDFNPQP
ncbi:MAG: DUF4382 domain-containing protein [Gammaproteobacteria bacterium]